MLTELKAIVETCATVTVDDVVKPLYPVEYEEGKMINVTVDEKALGARFAYIEEFTSGAFSKPKYMWSESTQVQIYFCRFCEFQNTAIEREAIREAIKSEVVKPFMNAYNASGKFDIVDTFKFYTPLPRFDANEVSIMLQFDCKQNMC